MSKVKETAIAKIAPNDSHLRTIPEFAPKNGEVILHTVPPARQGDKPTQTIVKMSKGGLVRAMLSRVPLRFDRKELWVLQGEAQVTALGYNKCNQFAGVSWFTPENLSGPDGGLANNPYFHEDDKGRMIYVRVRRVGIGRSFTGNMTAIDLTVTYNVQLYFQQDVFAKWAYMKYPAWGEIINDDAITEEMRRDPKRRLLPSAGGVTLSLDLSHPEVRGLFKEFTNRVKFAERNATTICERNILKRFFAVAGVGTTGYVDVMSWPTADMSFGEVADALKKNRSGEINLGGETVTVVEESETIADKDEIDGILAGDAEDETAKGDADGQQAPDVIETGEATPEMLAALRSKIREMTVKLPEEVWSMAYEANDFNALRDVAECESFERLDGLHAALVRLVK